MKKIVALLLTVLMVTSTVSTGFSAAYAEENPSAEVLSDVSENDNPSAVSKSEEQTVFSENGDTFAENTENSSETVTDPTEDAVETPSETVEDLPSEEETTEPTEETSNTAEESTDESEETTEATDETEEATDETPENPPQQPTAPEAGERFVGDINRDGTVNIIDVTDIQKCIAALLTLEDKLWGDANGDGELSVLDATEIQNLIAYGPGFEEIEEIAGEYDPERGKVTNLVSGEFSQTEINLSWDEAQGASGYEVFVYSYRGGYIKIADTAENNYTLFVDAAKGYNVCVRAWYEDNGKVYKGDFSDSINVLSAPSAGVLKSITRNVDGSFSVFVTADKYANIVSTQGDILAKVDNGMAELPGILNGFQAAIENKFFYGDKYASTISQYFTIEGEMPVLSANISVQGCDVTISWDRITGVSGYEVFKMNAEGEYVSVADTTALSFKDTVEKGSKNLYAVKYYVVNNGEKQYYSENLLEAVSAPEAVETISMWNGETTVPQVDSQLPYTLESLNPNIVTVNGNEITAVATGTAKVKVTGPWEEEVIITVTVRQAPTKLTLSTYNMIILETEKLTIRASVDEGAESKIKFTSSDPSKATVNDNGDVIAYKSGTVTVTAETENGIKAECKVNIYPVDLRTFKVDSDVMSSGAWASDTITTLKKNSQAFVLETHGAWLWIRYGGDTGWVYNKSFNTSIKNYSTIDTNTLPVIIDDWIFDNGKEIRTIFDYVRNKISYRNLGNDTVENLCVNVLRYGTGACYHYGALLYYMLDRAGYEAIIVDGIDLYTGGGPHRWNMVKVDGSWYHIDATPIIGLPDYYLVKDSAIEGVFSWDRSKYPATPK